MNLEHWKAILGTYRHVVSLLDARPRMKPEDLVFLQQQMLDEMFKLQRALSVDLRAGLVEDLLRPLTFLFDELVLRKLEEDLQPSWPMLQRHFFHVDAGGDLFYEFAEEKLRQPDTPSLIFEVLHFCLSAGFTGRYESWPAKVNDYMKALAARISRPPPTTPPPPLPPAEPMPAYEFPLRYYLTTGFVIVSLPVVLWVLSNH